MRTLLIMRMAAHEVHQGDLHILQVERRVQLSGQLPFTGVKRGDCHFQDGSRRPTKPYHQCCQRKDVSSFLIAAS